MTIDVESNCKLSPPSQTERQQFRASASTGFELMASYFRARYHISVLLKFIFYDLM